MNPWGRGRDHPHLKSPKGIMQCDEIRWWIRELIDNHGWPVLCLARTLGLPNYGALISKIREGPTRAWIYPGEQTAFSHVLDRIISGELVPGKPGKYRRVDAVVADHPVPLAQPARLAFDLATGRLGWRKPRPQPDPVLPSFRTILERAEKWP